VTVDVQTGDAVTYDSYEINNPAMDTNVGILNERGNSNEVE
jgi:hypothetical protein